MLESWLLFLIFLAVCAGGIPLSRYFHRNAILSHPCHILNIDHLSIRGGDFRGIGFVGVQFFLTLGADCASCQQLRFGYHDVITAGTVP